MKGRAALAAAIAGFVGCGAGDERPPVEPAHRTPPAAEISELEIRGGGANVDRKVKGTIHWVSATACIDAEVRLYDRLFTLAEPGATDDFKKYLNPHSLEVIAAKLEPSLANATIHDRFQFERLGYFVIDAKDSTPGKPVFNRTISLKDTWTKK